MRYGFLIDHNRCIGCHACTVACKEEHNVPVGVFRTWVKYIEKGEFPHSSRHFGVMRCNHCDDAPCIEICPTQALFRRDNGIVDFDTRRCIGCKSCMQACPYDALYLDPDSHTAAKCNFCAHRIEIKLEPACVIVCPTRAIIAGDIDNPADEISRIVGTQKVSVRKPHKDTKPKLFYAGIEGDFLEPSMMVPQRSHAFAEMNPADGFRGTASNKKPSPGDARVVYDVAHPQPWGAIPAFYLWTKSIAAGVTLVAAVLWGIFSELEPIKAGGWGFDVRMLDVQVPAVGLLFTAFTTFLLIADLHRPARFYYILIRPNPRSWLVIGTWILIIYAILVASWLGVGLRAGGPAATPIIAVTAVAAVFTSCYSGFLFAQAKGRDLWQSPVFIWHLLVQAVMAGAAVIILLTQFDSYPHIGSGSSAAIRTDNELLLAAIVVNALMILSELVLTPSSADVRYAVEIMTRGDLRVQFWLGAIGAGTIVPAGLLLYTLLGGAGLSFEVAAAGLALVGLLVFERVWIAAGQAAPLS